MHALSALILVFISFMASAEDNPPGLPFQPVDQAASQPSQAQPPEAAAQPVPAQQPAPAAAPAASEPTPMPASQSMDKAATKPIGSTALPPDASTVQGQAPMPRKPPKSAAKSYKRAEVSPASFPSASFGMMPERGGDGLTIRAKQGKTYNVYIARGQLNRIVTPFADPKVLTTVSGLESKVEGSAVYLATDSSAPANLFISDSDSSDAISLQLIPSDMARPAEIRIEMDKAGNAGGSGGLGSGKDEHSGHPYVDEVKRMMRSLALGNVPQGFTLSDPQQAGRVEICAMPGVDFRLGQFLNGTRINLMVVLAHNGGHEPIILDETACASRNVLAVAAWPKIRLAPGEKTEIYVAIRAPSEIDQEQTRPSLLAN